MQSCALLAVPGGDPSPIAGMIWALREHAHLLVQQLHLVFYAEAQSYFHAEFLEGYNPDAQLRQQGWNWTTQERLVRSLSGAPLEDDVDPEDAQRFVEAIWQEAQRAQEQAGEMPVIFALMGGKRRTLTVDMVMVFQLLARPQDRLYDLRPLPKDVSGPSSGFYFPSQDVPQVVRDSSGQFYEASEVSLQLVPVTIPRLRQLLPSVSNFQQALLLSINAIQAHIIPSLRIQLDKKESWIEIPDQLPQQISLSDSQFYWYAALALARKQGSDGVDCSRPEAFCQILARAMRLGALTDLKWYMKDHLRIGQGEQIEYPDPEDLQMLRVHTRRTIEKRLEHAQVPNAKLLIPVAQRSGGRWKQSLLLDAAYIRVLPD